METALRYCSVRREGRITIVTLQRPEVMNALHEQAHHELAGVWDEFARDEEQWVGILTGAGDRAFCAGNDLKATAAGTSHWGTVPTGFAGLTARFDNDKPVIAAVNGVAAGGGFEAALACDIIIAEEHARFGLPEPSVGLAAGAGGLHRLPRTIGLKRAMGMLLTARLVDAQEGYALGFVTEVVARGTALARAREMAGRICELSPMAVRAAKHIATRGLAIPDLAEACRTEFDAMKALRASHDYREGPRAFTEKRKPVWKPGKA